MTPFQRKLRQLIKDGLYVIDPYAVADAILERAFGDLRLAPLPVNPDPA